jgi:hypothetical protein
MISYNRFILLSNLFTLPSAASTALLKPPVDVMAEKKVSNLDLVKACDKYDQNDPLAHYNQTDLTFQLPIRCLP